MAGLQFEYCECGCKGHAASVGPWHYWIFNDLLTSYTLHRGHGHSSPVIGKFDTFPRAKRAAQADVDERFKKVQAAYDSPKSDEQTFKEACALVESFMRSIGPRCQSVLCEDGRTVSVAPLAWGGDATGPTLYDALIEAKKASHE